MARVVVTGATGLIGRALVNALRGRGDQVVALSRDCDRARSALGEGVELHPWGEPEREPAPAGALAGAQAVVHLLGEPIAQRWSAAAKRSIHASRELGTRMLVAGVDGLSADARPATLISQSAVGFYGSRGGDVVDEGAAAGSGFLAGVTAAWEGEAQTAGGMMRVAITRTGVVLATEGGALAKLLPFFRLGLGGPVAGGRQYVPWVHLDDVVGALLFLLDHSDAQGPINLTAPSPATNAELARALGRVLGRPAVLPAPGFALRLLYGEMAETVITGQRAVPKRLQELGYEFRYPELEAALAALLAR